MKRLNLFNIDLILLVARDALAIDGTVPRTPMRIWLGQP